MLTQEQKEARRIGGSDIGTILGLNTKKTPLKLYLEKTGQEPSDFPDGEDAPDYIRFGNIMEAVIAGEYSRRRGVKLRRVNQTVVSEKYPWMTAHPDRLVVGQRKGLECKNTWAFNKDFGSDFADDVPDIHLVQCMHYMIVMEYKEWDLAVCLGGNKYKDYSIRYNDRLAKAIVEASEDFWKRIQEGRAPDIKTVDDARLMYPKATAEKVVELSSDYASDLMLLAKLKAEKKQIESEADLVEARVMAAMGDADTAISEGRPLATWKNQSATRLDTTKLKTDRPEIYKEFSKTTESRVFRLSKATAALESKPTKGAIENG